MNFNNRTTKNLAMNPDVYSLRRKVMSLIYEAGTVVNLPRLTVRITDNDVTMLGCARMGGNIIWMTESAINGGYDIRAIVYHEIAHAVFNAGHDASSPLMKPTFSVGEIIPVDVCQSELEKVARKWTVRS